MFDAAISGMSSFGTSSTAVLEALESDFPSTLNPFLRSRYFFLLAKSVF